MPILKNHGPWLDMEYTGQGTSTAAGLYHGVTIPDAQRLGN
jgi:hypothetical protein